VKAAIGFQPGQQVLGLTGSPPGGYGLGAGLPFRRNFARDQRLFCI